MMFFRGIAVGQSSILSPEEIAKEALDAKADIVVVENEDLLKRVLLIQHKLPELKAIVQIKGEPPVSDKRRLNRTHKVIFNYLTREILS
jgi:long-subunit acyl-CoA synthetase (AMP-forming)